MPATFRTLLAKSQQQEVVLYQSFRLPALEGTRDSYMTEINRRMQTLRLFSDEHEDLSILFARSRQLPFDGEGRIILPPEFRDFAEIDDEATFVGRGETFQIWNPRRYTEHEALVNERIRREGRSYPAASGPAAAPRA